MKKILRSSALCLFLCSLAGGGCASAPVSTRFDGKWEFIERPGQPVKACLAEDDVAKLRELLIRCRATSETD